MAEAEPAIPARRPAPAPVHGWLVIDKPTGVTSTKVVTRVRRLTGAAKAGHAGTLDPLATGVLPIALGEATKTVPFVVDGSKSYRFTIRWGEQRDTDDAEGRVIATSAHRPDPAEITAALAQFTGEIMQVPPTYSAIKIAGRRAYELARNEQDVTLAARPVRIDRMALIEATDADHALLELDCGKGSYVRALARDLARALGTVGHLAALCRTRVGPFTLADSISLAQIEALDDSAALADRLLPVACGLSGIASLPVNADQAARLKHGQMVPLVRAPVDEAGNRLVGTAVLCAVFAGRPAALVRLEAGEIRPTRVFNL
ncbi:MAG: tRNA pseudouridine(55) synthase TruB [Alphaproteobacteria bacterium]|nr:tRNA pseudouridine(55) synthase TruB [Alphaproteobacteria bacterium]MDP6516451.1 tRNA pseudouridine(55) synthase TruB [Alphaproteobacteria bacterium]